MQAVYDLSSAGDQSISNRWNGLYNKCNGLYNRSYEGNALLFKVIGRFVILDINLCVSMVNDASMAIERQLTLEIHFWGDYG